MKKVRWGILSTAKIGRLKVIPAMQAGLYCEITAISSQNYERAKSSAEEFNIPKAYGSYEELLADPEIDAVYNPLPNHLHVPWTIKALEAGKHVLCEKPISLTVKEAEYLLSTTKKFPQLKVMEALMYRFHPQWIKVKELVDSGKIGELKTVNSFFSYSNLDPNNIRNKADIGGGGLMDIGSYLISFPRFLFGNEPINVSGMIEYNQIMKVDILTSGMMKFKSGTATFTCSTQLSPFQRTNIFGTKGRIEVEIPVNTPSDKPTRIFVESEGKTEEIVFDSCDQYTLQGDAFSKSIIDDSKVPTLLEDAVLNMKVLEAVVKSYKSNMCESI
ncbi:MAG: Gfo/Idh/MocA family oxidoreductase [Melioribacteraceae bacterium]|nr:Gfo/Idh/MocA family oxidoreductase [Melioribacteraceae bacterium]